MNVEALLAKRVRDLRKAHGHTLDDLAEASGVSRSTISLIERQEISPTAVVLNKLADALGVTMATLFTDDAHSAAQEPLARRADQQTWKDPATGYLRRHVSPAGFDSPLELVEVHFPPGESVTFDNVTRHSVTHQQVWLLEGEMSISVGETAWQLNAGDCLAMVLDQQIVFHNPGRKPARYALALTTASTTQRTPK
ncbi:MAG TPA: helix-turn-helix domain-containing protein [Paraburkholderia sp.]|jgi:transcriptional regulator with XRE-family HTH domain|uniref:helix-turn-helix domain-containing protein n=1 Tax=Paraburkholderia sp. TaxID=1926495 RepID=UPI002DE387B0|nr:helix-turn-helix domain-containing protein [Paraburkholderia sp.]